jgi:hypothetical protein
VDVHRSRLADAEIHPDQTSQTAVGFLARAQGWFADRGVVIQRVLTDDGGCYRSRVWAGPATNWGSSTSGPGLLEQTNG